MTTEETRFQNSLKEMFNEIEAYRDHLYANETGITGLAKMVGFLDAQLRILAIRYMTAEDIEVEAASVRRYVKEQINKAR